MHKVAIVILADTESYEGLGRLANALFAAAEFKEAGDDIKIIFDGAGVKWIDALSKPDHMYHEMYQKLGDCIAGVCEYCAKAFKVNDAVEAQNLAFADEYQGHPSFRQLISSGHHILTF
jgi:hypothetical protein